MDDVKQMDNEQLRTQAHETMSEWDDIEAHLGTQNKASIGLFHSRSDDLRVLLEAAVGRLELAGPAPADGPSLAREQLAEVGIAVRLPGGTIPDDVFADSDIVISVGPDGRAEMVKNRWGAHMQVPVYGGGGKTAKAYEEEVVMRWLNDDDPRIVHVEDRDYWKEMAEASGAVIPASSVGKAAETLDGLIGGLRGRIDGGTIMELLMASQVVYGLVLNAPGHVSEEKREELSEQARVQAEEERRVIEEVRAAAPEVEDPDEADRTLIREAVSQAMEDAEEVAAFPEGTGKRYEWHVVATGVAGTVEAKAFSHDSGPDPDESKRLFEEMWNAYEMIYNDAPNSISVNIEDLS